MLFSIGLSEDGERDDPGVRTKLDGEEDEDEPDEDVKPRSE